MITKLFSLDDLKTYRLYYVLDKIANTAVALYRRTPAGDELFEDADVLVMQDGHLVIALKHPFKYSPNMCLFAKYGDTEEVVNLNYWEKIIDVYDTDIDHTDQGGFFFCSSKEMVIPEQEWRCDNTMYGPDHFGQRTGLLTSINKLKAYEPILSLHGVGYLIYLHFHDDAEIRETVINNSEIPIGSLTLSEMFKIIYEWSEVSQEPFNNTEAIAVKAKQFLDCFGFTPDLVDNQVDMQVANYLRGSTDARRRPAGVVANKPSLIDFVKKNMAASSLAELCVQYPGMWDAQEILTAEQQALSDGIDRFNEFYAIPEGWTFDNPDRYVEHCVLYFNPTIGPYVHNQIRLFVNKSKVLLDLANSLHEQP